VTSNTHQDTKSLKKNVNRLRLNDIALLNKSPQLYGESLAIWDHKVLPAIDTSEHTPLSPQPKGDTRFVYSGGMVTGYIPRWFTPTQTVSHLSTNQSVHGQQSNLQPVDHKSDALTTTLPSHLQYSSVVSIKFHLNWLGISFPEI